MLEVYKKYCKGGKKGKAPKEVEEAVRLLGWDIDPACIPFVASRLALLLGLVSLLLPVLYITYNVIFEGFNLVDFVLYAIEEGDMTFFLLLVVPVIVAVSVYFFVLYYPVQERDKVAKEMLPLLPENIGYIVLSMRLTPNIEKALEFVAEHGRGKFVDEVKKILWEVRMGIRTTEEGIDRLAYKWGRFLPELKHALMGIRESVMEEDREAALKRALDEVTEGVGRKLEDMAAKLYVPSVQLFYLGVFLPLLLFIVIPVAASFSDLPISFPVLAFLYILLIPAVTYAFIKSILSKRPYLYPPPEPKIIFEKKGFKEALVVLIVGMLAVYYLHTLFDITYDKVEELYCGTIGCLKEKYGFSDWEEGLKINEVKEIISSYDTTPYVLILGSLLVLTISAAILVYLSTEGAVKTMKKYREMEEEFKDAVYVLASRMGEGKPFEGALESVIDFMPESTVVQELFSKILYNIKGLGLALRDAVFDKYFGALSETPSEFLRNAMKVVVSSVELGAELASRALISFSSQLRKQEEVMNTIKSKLSEIKTMMTAMALFVGPAVLGITVALQYIVVTSLTTTEQPEIPQDIASQLGIGLPTTKKVELPSGTEFLIVVALYNLILSLLLTYYSSKLYNEGRSEMARKMVITAVISLVVFSAAVLLSMNIIRGMIE